MNQLNFHRVFAFMFSHLYGPWKLWNKETNNDTAHKLNCPPTMRMQERTSLCKKSCKNTKHESNENKTNEVNSDRPVMHIVVYVYIIRIP